RLFVLDPLMAGASVELASAQVHYLRNVLRLAPGAALTLFNGRDGEWRATLAASGKRVAAAEVAEPLRPQTSEPDLWLCFAPLKRARIDWLVEKASELGVARLQPTITARTVAERVNLERLRAHAVEAAEQC